MQPPSLLLGRTYQARRRSYPLPQGSHHRFDFSQRASINWLLKDLISATNIVQVFRQLPFNATSSCAPHADRLNIWSNCTLHIDCNMYRDIYQSLWWHQGLHFRSWALSRPYWPSNPFAPTWSSRPLLWRGIPQVSHLWWLSHQSRGAPRDYLFEIPMKVPVWRAEDWQQNIIATHPNLQLPTELYFHFNFQKTNHTELGRDNQLEVEAE